MPEPPKELSQVAHTLADLKKLPPEQKDRLFLAKLAWISRNDTNVLNKRNLTLPNDPYGLAKSYPIQEKREVIEHLLGAPWTRLVNEGYLVDLNGQGFHKVSGEGHDFLNQPDSAAVTIAPTRKIATLPDPIDGVPRVFISYSWDSQDHQTWVTALAERLTGHGIQIIFDRWHLKPGYNKSYFMEQAIATSDFVIIVCTDNYANKANARQGGVGYESTIITAEVGKQALTDKFIPVLRQGSFDISLPIYLSGHLGVDLRGDPYIEDAYKDLLRQLHGEPIVAPPIGKKPDFLTDSSMPPTISSSGTFPIRTAISPIEQKPNASVWARFDKPGQANAWISGIIRSWDLNRYSFEIVKGNDIESEQFFTTKDQVVARFTEFQQSLLEKGYIRMQFTPGPDPDFRKIS